MQISFIQTTPDWLETELAIINSNPFYNRITKGKEQLTPKEIQDEIEEATALGAERHLIFKGEKQAIGIVEFLSLNPNDGYPWLGLFMIHREYQANGIGSLAFTAWEKQLIRRGFQDIRLAVVIENEPAHAFWKRQQFRYVGTAVTQQQLQVVTYEKHFFNE